MSVNSGRRISVTTDGDSTQIPVTEFNPPRFDRNFETATESAATLIQAIEMATESISDWGIAFSKVMHGSGLSVQPQPCVAELGVAADWFEDRGDMETSNAIKQPEICPINGAIAKLERTRFKGALAYLKVVRWKKYCLVNRIEVDYEPADLEPIGLI